MKEKKVKATYIGKRRLTESSLGGAFKIGTKEFLFKKAIYCEIGREYWLVEYEDGYGCATSPDPCDDKEVKQTKQVLRWVNEETEAENEHDRLRAAKKIEKIEGIRGVTFQLTQIVDGMSYFEIKELVEHLVQKASINAKRAAKLEHSRRKKAMLKKIAELNKKGKS